jgi:hypothetical protein
VSLKESIGYRDDTRLVPISIRLKFQRLEDQISREDYAAADASFRDLEEQTEPLALLTSQFQLLIDQLSNQYESINQAMPPPRDRERNRGRDRERDRDRILLEGVVNAEYRMVLDLLSSKWDTEADRENLSQKIKQARKTFESVYAAILEFLTRDKRVYRDLHTDLRELLTSCQAGNFDNTERRYSKILAAKRITRPEQGPQAAQTTPQSMPPNGETQPSRRGLRRWIARWARPDSQRLRSTARSARSDSQRLKFLFRQARVLAGAASVIVVTLVGLKVQYLDNQQFDGALSAWLALALWGAVIELSGVSILDVVGRLGSSGAAPPGSARP